MKKLILFFLIGLSSLTYAQKLSVTPNGLRDASDTEKSFVIINVEGKTAKQLYDNALKYVNKNYKNPEEVIKGKIENEYLKFITYASDVCIVKNMIKISYAVKYTTELSFKDGKIKYEIIELNMYNPENNVPLEFSGSEFGSFCIYNKKGTLKRESTKNEIENYFNSQIKTIEEFLQGTKVEEKW